MADTHAGASSHYFIPAPSQWPAVGSIAMVFTMFGAALVVNRNPIGWVGLGIGLLTLVYMMFGWFSTVSAESERGSYNRHGRPRAVFRARPRWLRPLPGTASSRSW